jgi:peptide/nickel transport system substrate-binding protein
MIAKAPYTSTGLTRRGVLHGTLRGIVGFTAWQSWPPLQRAMAQKGTPTGQMTWAMHFTLTPTWFDPAETGGLLTLTIGLYALHDALVKPMPDGQLSPCLATQWRASEDGVTYDFTLRQGVTFQNGDPFTAEDVQFRNGVKITSRFAFTAGVPSSSTLAEVFQRRLACSS